MTPDLHSQVPLSELRRAYEILGMPHSASALAIRRSYRRLVKRWHPDLYPDGTSACIDATHMMKLINEAYSKILHAPLRYRIQSYPGVPETRSQYPKVARAEPTSGRGETLPITDRLEFWIRFACGALFGLFMGLTQVLNFYDEPKILAAGTGTLILLCGLGAARYGDRFWYRILQYGWLWW